MKTILIIDDSIDLLDLQKVILELEGYNVLTAFNVKEAFDLLSFHQWPDLILLDFQLRGSTGLDFLNLLENKCPQIFSEVPVVFYSGRDEIPQSKAVGFISKLSGMDELINSIKTYISGWPKPDGQYRLELKH